MNVFWFGEQRFRRIFIHAFISNDKRKEIQLNSVFDRLIVLINLHASTLEEKYKHFERSSVNNQDYWRLKAI